VCGWVRRFSGNAAEFDARMILITDSAKGATFSIKVHPRARKNAITGEVGESLKIAVSAPPTEGRANEACIGFLAEILEIPRSSITIAAGATGRTKLIRVQGMSAVELTKRLYKNV
jgi:uncharacterized protein (TIGR00251 family)